MEPAAHPEGGTASGFLRLNQLFDGLNIDKASIVGNSYGGFLAFNQASLAPHRVERIVAISPPGVFVSILPRAHRLLRRSLISAILRLTGVRPTRKTIADFLVPDATFRQEDADWLAFSEHFLNGGVRVNVVMPRVFSTAELRKLEAPALLLVAERETMYRPDKALHTASARMSRLRCAIVPGAHHLAAMADPAFVDGAIVEFLNTPAGWAEAD